VRGEFFYPFQIQFEHINPFLFLFTNVLRWAAGPLLLLGALAGLGLMAWRRRPADRVLLAWFVVSVALTGNAQVMFMRYALPFLPLLALAVARLVTGLREMLPEQRARVISPALALLIVLPSLHWSLALASVHREEDSRITAGRYLKAALPDGAVLLHERSANSIKPVIHRPRYVNVCLEMPGIQRAVEAGLVTPGEQLEALEARLEGVQWAAILESNRKLGFDRNGGYPVIREFYRSLWAGELGFEPDTVFKTLPSAFGIAVDDEPAEFSLRYYDHEEVQIFRLRDPAQVKTAFAGLRERLADAQDRTAALAEQALAEGRLEDARAFAEQGLKTGPAGSSRFYAVLAQVFLQAALLGSGSDELDAAAHFHQKAIQSEHLFRERRVAEYGEFLLSLGQTRAVEQLLQQAAAGKLHHPRLEQLARRLQESGTGVTP
jgi:hypothetical protein